jgi:hypothetical protein
MIIVDKPDGDASPITAEPEPEVSAPEMDDTPQPQFISSGEIVDFILSWVEDGPQQPVNAAPTLVNISPESEPEEPAPALVGMEREMQKALDGFGKSDRLLKLRQNKMF